MVWQVTVPLLNGVFKSAFYVPAFNPRREGAVVWSLDTPYQVHGPGRDPSRAMHAAGMCRVRSLNESTHP